MYMFSPVSSTNKTYRYDITEILLNVALNTINQPGNNMASSVDSISLSIYFVLKSILKTISGSCKSNYHMITTTMASIMFLMNTYIHTYIHTY
jgi:hypothetical protein